MNVPGDIAGESMSFFFQTRYVAALCVVATPMAFAQVDQARVNAEQQAESPVPISLDFTSSFANYHPFTEQPVLPWREANDTVRQIGGWRAYAKEVLQPEPTATPAPAAVGVKP
jgi:hypothetical protein